MDNFFDEAARILASEMPRRQALMRLSTMFVGGVLTTLGVRPVQAQPVPVPVCSPACPGNKPQCCTGTPSNFCVASTAVCCGNTACVGNRQCCPGNGIPFCATLPKKCCGATTCKPTEVCCPATKTCCKQCNQFGNCTPSPS